MVLNQFGRQKFREIGRNADAIRGVLDRVHEREQALNNLMVELSHRRSALDLQLRALTRFAPSESAESETQRPRIEAEIVRTEQALAEAREDLVRVGREAEQPRADRRALVALVERLSKHLGDEGAMLIRNARGAA